MPKTLSFALSFLLLGGCNGDIYVRDGVTNGDTFYVSNRALSDDDPELQSWVRYSLAKSTCQLEMGGDNPARNHSFGCELTARRHLVDAWQENRPPGGGSRYLDELLLVSEKGFLDEYVAQHFRRRGWQLPAELELGAFRRWEKLTLPGHRPETRLTGSWNYGARVATNTR